MIKMEMQNVCLRYSQEEILRDMTFEVHPGEMVGLIGPNGSGKSTTIRALSRIVSPYRGKILLDGKDIARIPRQALARMIGVVPQMPLLPSAFTAFEVVLMGRNPHLDLFQSESQRDRDMTWHAMEQTMTLHLAKRRVGELSGGEIQSLLIARVLVQDTKAILLDEPTANLDISRQVEILNLMRRLCLENNTAVLTALHDLNMASQYCNRLVLINGGRVHAQGPPDEVITPQNIKEVYGADGCVYEHPANRLPAVLLSPNSCRVSDQGALRKKGGA